MREICNIKILLVERCILFTCPPAQPVVFGVQQSGFWFVHYIELATVEQRHLWDIHCEARFFILLHQSLLPSLHLQLQFALWQLVVVALVVPEQESEAKPHIINLLLHFIDMPYLPNVQFESKGWFLVNRNDGQWRMGAYCIRLCCDNLLRTCTS